MKTTNVPNLEINIMNAAQYKRELAAGNIKPDVLYLTKDETPTITYGTEDLVPGESPLPPGTLYLVYEES